MLELRRIIQSWIVVGPLCLTVGCGPEIPGDLATAALSSAPIQVAVSPAHNPSLSVAPARDHAATDPAAQAMAALAGATTVEPEVFPTSAEVRRGERRTLEFHVINHRPDPIQLGRATTSCGCVEVIGGETEVPGYGAAPIKVVLKPRSNSEFDYFQFPWTGTGEEDEGQVAVEIRIRD